MEQLTREQQLANIDLAERLWRERVAPNQVIGGLHTWVETPDCGSAACFGGWIARFPEFREMGVRRLKEIDPDDYFGVVYGEAPAFDKDNWGVRASIALFGDASLFEPRGGHPADPSWNSYWDDDLMSDHELVLKRLAAARQRLQEGS